jgi:hypothetical protein
MIVDEISAAATATTLHPWRTPVVHSHQLLIAPLNSALNPTCILLIPIITTDGAKQGVNYLFGDPKVILSSLLFHLPLCHASAFDTSLTKSFSKVNAGMICGLLVHSDRASQTFFF